MKTKEALINYCLRLGDNNLVLGQRFAEWCSNGPILEEDLAMTNFSLDCFGQAELYFNYAAELEGKGHDADHFAYHRNERQYFNALIVEMPNGDFAMTMMKLFLYSAFSKLNYESLSTSPDETLANLAARSLKEVKYHFRHSSEWIVRFGNGTEESKFRVQNALNELWMYTSDMFEITETDTELMELGVINNAQNLLSQWHLLVNEILMQANLTLPSPDSYMAKGGYLGNHTEHLGHLLCELQYLQKSHQGASW